MSTHQISQTKYFRSIFLPGLYALQCVSRVSGAPDVTIYREDLSSLIGNHETSQMSLMRAQKRFAFFVLRHSRDRCDIYDKKGRFVRDPAERPSAYATMMSPTAVVCDNKRLAAQSTWLLNTPTVCASFEAHTGQSAAARGNFYTMLDQLLNLAPGDKDRAHIYVLSHHSPCPRSVIVADLSRTTECAQGLFLDYFKRLQNGWPLHEAHHKTELARTLASCRYTELRQWLYRICATSGNWDDPDRLALTLSAIPLSVRFELARAFVNVVYPKVFLPDGGIERINDDDVYAMGAEVGTAIGVVMQTPMSKI